MSTTALVFIAGYGFSLVRSLMGYPIWGLFAYFGSFYLHPPTAWWGQVFPSSIRWSLVAAVVTLVSLANVKDLGKGRPSWLAHPLSVIFLLFVAYMYIQIPWVISRFHDEGVVLFTKYLILVYVIYKLIDSEEMLRQMLLAHFLGCAYLGYLAYDLPARGRLESVGGPGIGDANTLGMHLSTGVIIGSFMLLTEKGVYRIGILCSLPFVVNGLILTQSRGAFLGLVAGGLATAFLKPGSIKKIYWVLVACAIAGFLALAGNSLLDRVQQLTGGESGEEELDSSAESRIHIAKAQLEMFGDYPMGVGFRGTTHLSPNYIAPHWLSGGARASHNTLLSTLVNGGVVGIILYLSLFFVTAITLIRLRALDRRGLPRNLALYRTSIGGSLMAAFLAGQTADYTKAEVQVWLLAGLIVLVHLSRQAVAQNASGAAQEIKPKRPGRFRIA